MTFYFATGGVEKLSKVSPIFGKIYIASKKELYPKISLYLSI